MRSGAIWPLIWVLKRCADWIPAFAGMTKSWMLTHAATIYFTRP